MSAPPSLAASTQGDVVVTDVLTEDKLIEITGVTGRSRGAVG